MSNRLHKLILALAASGLTAAAWAQSAPDSGGPAAAGSPATGWHEGEHGEYAARKWGEDGGDHEGHQRWQHRHHHHHHHHHCRHHHGWHEGHEGWHEGHEGWHEGHEGWHGPDGMRDGGMMGEGPGRAPGLMHLLHALNLSDAQRQQVRTILTNAHEQSRQPPPGGASDFAALINPGDPNHAAAVQAAKKRAGDRVQRMSDLQTQLYNVLTSEQKSQLTRMVAEWKSRMGPPAPAKAPPAPASR